MNTKRNKRWNGDLAKLSADYLKNVIEKMLSYGNNIQFSSNGTMDGPHYQVINEAGKKIAFSGGNMLRQPADDDFIDEISATIYSLDQIKSLSTKTNSPTTKNTSARTKRVAGTATGAVGTRGGAALTKLKEQIAIQKYEYYKTNRSSLPPDIREHSEEITRMMERGMSAELAFSEAIKLCFVHQD